MHSPIIQQLIDNEMNKDYRSIIKLKFFTSNHYTIELLIELAEYDVLQWKYK